MVVFRFFLNRIELVATLIKFCLPQSLTSRIFLTLLVAPFIQHLRAFDEETGDEVCEALWREEIVERYADIAKELSQAYVLIGTLLGEGIEHGNAVEVVKTATAK